MESYTPGAGLMIRRCGQADFAEIWTIINDGAQAYKGVIPADRLADPYMSREALQHEIDDGVIFWGLEQDGPSRRLIGVMGIQHMRKEFLPHVTLIRHAYIRTANQGQGIGARLLSYLRTIAGNPILIGTWANSTWAIRFYQKHGFELVSPQQKDRLLRQYWTVPERQIETSVVLADASWRALDYS